MTLSKGYRNILTVIIFLISTLCANAQCSSAISTFPYIQNFETSNGGWFSGGNNSDWEWGAPQKPIIYFAASGTKAWMTGGLSGSSYASNEASWLQSPCFDFTSLQYPRISFNIFWETELQFDGASFQYSLDLGNTWKDAGSINDATNCLNTNWFNNSSVRFLNGLSNSGSGWSGNIQSSSGSCRGGGGSREWLLAQKSLPELASKKNVLFRFVFGAGSTCNAFDGFAMDDFTIAETPANNADFTSDCDGFNTVSFTNLSAYCPTNFNWNFGDPASGAKNTAFDENPSHTFSAGGTYTVTLTVSSPTNAPSTISYPVTVLDLTYTILTPVKCFSDNNGSVKVDVSGGAAPYSYSWNTVPEQTNATATDLSPGTYTVNVTGSGACPASLTINMTAPPPLSHTTSIVNPGCMAPGGSISITESGGTAPYTYSWSPNVSNTSSATGLLAGRYDITVTDKGSCTDIISIDLVNVIPPTPSLESKTDVSCFGGSNGSATMNVTGGTAPLIYSWSINPDPAVTTASGLKAGNYNFKVTDAEGCTGNTSVTITEPPLTTVNIITKDATCNLPNGRIDVIPSGGISNYQYTWAPPVSTGSSAVNIIQGRYSVEITDNAGCIIIPPEIRIINKGTPSKIFLGKDTTICTGEKVILSPAAQGNYIWQDNSTAPTFIAERPGKYWVQLTNSDACISSDTILVNVVRDCVDIYFPSVFSPNGDGLNEQYGPVGNLNAVSNYSLSIYNRWGELIFTTNDPRKRWNGDLNGKLTANASFTWFASYTFAGSGQKFKKGVLVIIR